MLLQSTALYLKRDARYDALVLLKLNLQKKLIYVKKELWVECGDDDDCCTGNCGKIPPGNTEYTCCIPASYS